MDWDALVRVRNDRNSILAVSPRQVLWNRVNLNLFNGLSPMMTFIAVALAIELTVGFIGLDVDGHGPRARSSGEDWRIHDDWDGPSAWSSRKVLLGRSNGNWDSPAVTITSASMMTAAMTMTVMTTMTTTLLTKLATEDETWTAIVYIYGDVHGHGQAEDT